MKVGLSELTAFTAIAEHKSFRTAALRLGMSPSALSHSLRHLEERPALFSEDREGSRLPARGLVPELQEPLPVLNADQAQLERVLDNLLDNALRHTADGGQIRLQARRHAERVIISIEDNGEGIAYSQQGRIFEPFVQVGRKKGGAGLGLALCKEIVQLHGGRIGVYSRPGQGTQFYMALPLL